MKYDEIINRVQKYTGLTEGTKAEQVLKAVLGTLGENVYRTEERHMAAELPNELKNVFYEYQPPERGKADRAVYPLEEFYNRVKARANITLQESQEFTSHVLTVLQEAVSPGEMEDVIREIRPELRKLFAARPEIEYQLPQEIEEMEKVTFTEYHILPAEGRQWMVRRGESREIFGIYETKEAAIANADDLADRDQGDILVIHNADGSISKREAPSREPIT